MSHVFAANELKSAAATANRDTLCEWLILFRLRYVFKTKTRFANLPSSHIRASHHNEQVRTVASRYQVVCVHNSLWQDNLMEQEVQEHHQHFYVNDIRMVKNGKRFLCIHLNYTRDFVLRLTQLPI